jgi:selenide,water dikinase
MRPGDRLYLTKPLGLGLISTAIKAGKATDEQVRAAVDTMTTLNAAAAEAMGEAGVRAATDVTGFGLLGHLHIALDAGGVAAQVDAAAVPFLVGSLDLARDGLAPSGTRRNLEFLVPYNWDDQPEWERLARAAPRPPAACSWRSRRSGPLPSRPPWRARGIAAPEVGVVTTGEAGRVAVRGHPAAWQPGSTRIGMGLVNSTVAIEIAPATAPETEA